MKITKTQKEEIEIKCPMFQKEGAIEYAVNNGYTVSRSGPLMLEFPKVDVNTFHLIGHKCLGIGKEEDV